MTARILLAEDDPKQVLLLRRYLERDGHAVIAADNGRTAVERARATNPDLVILDLMLPEIDGFDVCRILRRDSDVPILMLTARRGEDDLLLGLDLGADDYLTKPFSPRELVARARVLLRRRRHLTPDHMLRSGDVVLDERRFLVHRAGHRVELTSKEFAILQMLLAEPGRVFTRSEIIDRVFGFDNHVLARTVDAHVMNLRRKLRVGQAARPDPVETVYGRGYRLVDSS